MIIDGNEALQTVDALFKICEDDGVECCKLAPTDGRPALTVMVGRGAGAEFITEVMQVAAVLDGDSQVEMRQILRELGERPSEAQVQACLRRLEAL